MWKTTRILPLLIASWGLCACTGQQVKTAGKYAAIGTAQLAADVFLGIEPPTQQEQRADRIMADHRERQQSARIEALTAEYEEFLRTKADRPAPEADPVPVVIEAGDDREPALSELDRLF